MVASRHEQLFVPIDQRGRRLDPGQLRIPGSPTALSFGGMVNGVASRSVAYVGVNGGTTRLYARSQSGGAFLPVSAYKGGTPRSIAVDPDNWLQVYIADSNGRIWMTTNGGQSFTDITGNLVPSGTISASNFSDFALAVYDQPPTLGVNEASDDVVFVGGWGGVWAAENPQAGTLWSRFGKSMPNVMVNGLIFNATDNVLLASTLGRGAWEVPNLSASVFQPAIPPPGQPPAVVVPGPQSTTGGTPLLFSNATGNAISIADPGAAATNTFWVTLSVTNGNLTLATVDGLDAPDDAGASEVKTFEGTLEEINAALDGLTFQSSNFGRRSILTASVDDQSPDGDKTDTETVAIQDLARDASPVLSGPSTVAATSQGPVIAIPAGPLSTGISSGALSINGIALRDASSHGGPETLTVYVSGGSLTFANNSTLSDGDTWGPITGTLANLNRYFQNNGASLSFTPTPNTQGTAWILITLANGTKTSSNPATAWIPIGVAALPPTIAAPQSLSTGLNAPIAFGSSRVGYVRVGNSDPLSQALEILVAAENGLVSLPNLTGITVIAGNPTGDHYLDITGTPDALNAALAAMIYTPDLGFRGYDTVSVDVVNTGELSDISPPPFSDSTDDDGGDSSDEGDSSDGGNLPASGAEDITSPDGLLAPGTPAHWDSSLATTTISILVGVSPVTVSAGGPHTTAAGGSLALSGSAYDTDGVPATFHWTINGHSDDSITGRDGSVSTTSLPAGVTSFQVGHLYAMNLSRPASLPILAVLRDTSGLTGSAETTVDLRGVATFIGPVPA